MNRTTNAAKRMSFKFYKKTKTIQIIKITIKCLSVCDFK